MSWSGRVPALQMAISSLMFGIGAVLIVFIQLDAVVIAFYRLFIGALLFAGLMLWQRQPFAINRRALLLASISGVMLGIDLALWNLSVRLIGPGISTILNSLQIFFMAGFGIAFYGHKPSAKLWFSLLMSFLGVVLLCSNEFHTKASGLGIALGIASAVAFALSMLSLREVANHQKNSVFNTMFYASGAGAVAVGVYCLLSGRQMVTDDAFSWAMMFVYGSVVHVLAWYLMAKAMPQLSVAVVGLLASFEPVIVVIIDVSFLDKALTMWQILGAVLTIVAIYLGSQSSAKSK